MDRDTYARYLACFHQPDHAAVLRFWAPAFEVRFAGLTLRGPQELLRFYGFFHAHVRETIEPGAMVGDAQHFFVEAVVRLQATRTLDAPTLQAQGYGTLLPLAAGQVVEMAQFIHYTLDDAGRFTRAVCALAG